MQTILDAVLFVYALTNTNIAGINFFYISTIFFLGDYGHFFSKVCCKWSEGQSMVLVF